MMKDKCEKLIDLIKKNSQSFRDGKISSENDILNYNQNKS